MTIVGGRKCFQYLFDQSLLNKFLLPDANQPSFVISYHYNIIIDNYSILLNQSYSISRHHLQHHHLRLMNRLHHLTHFHRHHHHHHHGKIIIPGAFLGLSIRSSKVKRNLSSKSEPRSMVIRREYP